MKAIELKLGTKKFTGPNMQKEIWRLRRSLLKMKDKEKALEVDAVLFMIQQKFNLFQFD